jgi:LmbE family N-acetylglucosaminyl deacetylase
MHRRSRHEEISSSQPRFLAILIKFRDFSRIKMNHLKKFDRDLNRILIVFAVLVSLLLVGASSAAAQNLTQSVEAIDRARVTTRILFVTAHPDDEWPGLLTYLSRGLGADVAVLTITRGQGGQNALGPEQGDEIGILRTQELLNADKMYGVQHQFFTRAADFGFSKSPEETLKIWGDAPLEDMVRVIRTFRPDVVINGWGGVHGGHGQHQASGILAPRAVEMAGDAKNFPDQIAEGLPAWKTPVMLAPAFGGGPGAIRIPAEEISPLFGKSYNDLGIEGRSQHVSQGTPAESGSSFLHSAIYLKVAGGSEAKNGVTLADLAEPLSNLAKKNTEIAPNLKAAESSLTAAREEALRLNWLQAAKDLAQAAKEIKSASGRISASSSSDLAFDLQAALRRIETALSDSIAFNAQARADRRDLVAGESFSVVASAWARPEFPVGLADPVLSVPSGWKIVKQETSPQGTKLEVSIPANAQPPVTPVDPALPWPPPMVETRYKISVDGYDFTASVAVVSIQVTSTQVLTYPPELVPAVSLHVAPEQIMLRQDQPAKQVELLARVRYHGTAPADVTAGVETPSGWSVTPVAPLHFSKPEDQLIRFAVTAPAKLSAGSYPLKPFARIGNQTFRKSIEPLPSLPTRSWMHPADATAHVLDLAVPAGLSAGYIAAEIDPIPDLLRSLDIRVDLLDETALAFGNLSRYDAIIVGTRAYELRADVVRANPRLLDYVRQGGTLVVQYERPGTWEKLHPAPFPASMSSDIARTTDENSPVRFVAPDNPVLNFPNKITMEDFKGWVQERGLYYWTDFDPRYQAILALRDPGEKEELGSLVYARDGKGVYIFTGLSFFRELPAGVPGAYRLFVNLLSQSKAPR